jgi:hypothetical protein
MAASTGVIERLKRTCLTAVAAVAAACAADREPFAETANLDMDACLAAIATGEDVNPADCPSFLMATALDASQLCRDVGGTIGAIEAADIWSIDVNGDDRPEHAFAIDDVVYCEGAASVFSCGSLGCPKGLYGERDGIWRLIGSLSAYARDDVGLADAVHEDGYRDLVVGCSTDENCVRWTYAWREGSYEADHADVRGYRVEHAASVHGLFALAADTPLLATPSADGEPLDRYAAGTEVAIIGTAGDYYYVSPCNACESGFVAAALIPSAR